MNNSCSGKGLAAANPQRASLPGSAEAGQGAYQVYQGQSKQDAANYSRTTGPALQKPVLEGENEQSLNVLQELTDITSSLHYCLKP